MKLLKKILPAVIISGFILSSFAGLAQTCGLDCVPCSEGQPCCTVYNACNAYQTFCYDCDVYYGTTDQGCDLSCAPIDQGVLFLLIAGGLFGSMLLTKRRTLSRVTC